MKPQAVSTKRPVTCAGAHWDEDALVIRIRTLEAGENRPTDGAAEDPSRLRHRAIAGSVTIHDLEARGAGGAQATGLPQRSSDDDFHAEAVRIDRRLERQGHGRAFEDPVRRPERGEGVQDVVLLAAQAPFLVERRVDP